MSRAPTLHIAPARRRPEPIAGCRVGGPAPLPMRTRDDAAQSDGRG